MLGLSRTTISIVLKGDAAKRKIPEHTVKRVMEAVEKYQYFPNHAARSLRRQQSNIIGVILPDFQLDWADLIMAGMMEVLNETSYSSFVAIHRFSPDLFRKEVLAAVQRRDEAVICFPLPGMSELYEHIHRTGIPLIFLSEIPLDPIDASHVIWDAGAAARTAVQHLVDIGRKRIAFLGVDSPMSVGRERFKGYKAVLRAAKLPIKPEWIWNPASGKTEVDAGLDYLLGGHGPKPDAIYALNDGIALIALEVLRLRGVRVPEDVAVVSMGDLRMTGHAAIGLSTMREPLLDMGRAAAQAALNLVSNPSKTIRRVITCNELRARRSTIGEQWNVVDH